MANNKDDKYEYEGSQRLSGWLRNFADSEAPKYAKDDTTANRLENILDIVGRQKKVSVEERVKHYRELVGLDMLDKIEKEGGREVVAKYIKLSQFDIVNNDNLARVKQYVEQLVKNRNGYIAGPAIFEQLKSFLRLSDDWLHENYEQVEKIINDTKQSFQPHTYGGPSTSDLARTEPATDDNEEQQQSKENDSKI